MSKRKDWQGEYQVVRWEPLSAVFKSNPLMLKGNAAPIPMTYPPKLDAVFDGRCTQTIRKGRKYRGGQVRWIFEWSGRPYRSKWGRRRLVEIIFVEKFEMGESGFDVDPLNNTAVHYKWDSFYGHALAANDGIEPPTGAALRDVLKGLNKGAKR